MRSTLAMLGVAVVLLVLLTSCTSENSAKAGGSLTVITNPVSYFEIPVADMDRAISFYEAVLAVSLERTVIDEHDMALFPFDQDGGGISGALAAGDSYVPSTSGPRIYFFVEDLDVVLSRAIANGGRVAYAKTFSGTFWVAEIEDSEGNQIALSSANE